MNRLDSLYGCDIPGCTTYPALVLTVNFSNDRATFKSGFIDKYGAKSVCIPKEDGGSLFNTILANNNYGGPRYLIAPNKSITKYGDLESTGIKPHVHSTAKQFPLTLTSGTGGTAAATPAAAQYDSGAVVTLTATASTGYEFAGWTGDTSGTTNPLSVKITKARTITASFKVKIDTTAYTLTVNSGTGDGNYKSGTSVAITADLPATGKMFDRWSGDSKLLADSLASATTLTMTTKAATITAIYKDIPVGIDSSNLSVNLIEHAGWEAVADEYGSTANIDTANLTKGVSAQYVTVADDEAAEKYAYSIISGYFEKPFTETKLFKVTYTADKPVRMVLDQEPLSADGIAFGYDLPAGTDKTLYLELKSFTQPDWIETAQKATLDLTKVTSISFEAVNRPASTAFALSELKATNYTIDSTGISANKLAKPTSLQFAGISAGTLNLQIPTAGTYAISVFSLNGRQLFSETRSLSAGSVAIPSGLTNSGVYLISIEGLGVKSMFKSIVR